MTLDDFLGKLKGVRRNGSGWVALCPAHQDHNPSLSIHQDGGKKLLHCHAGCRTEEVLNAVGLTMADLLQESPKASGKIVAKYPYADESGALLFEVVRYEPKDFRQRRPDGRGGWIWKLDGVRHVPYNLLEVIKANSVFICEGEKDCETARTLGLVVTCNPGGAGKWRSEYAQFLRGKQVAIIPDADEPGRKHARDVARSLLPVAESVRLVELPGAKDLSDWVERGGTRGVLQELLEATQVVSGADLGAHQPVVGILASDVTPEPVTWLWPGRIPLGKVTLIDGDPGLGKSCIITDIAARISRGYPMPDEPVCSFEPAGVVICSCEDGFADTIVPRLIVAGADLKRIRLINNIKNPISGEDRLLTLPADVALIDAAIKSVDAKLVVIDPLMAYFGPKTDSKVDQDIRRTLAPLAQMAERHGVAVIVIRHLNKGSSLNPLYRGGGSIGIIAAARMAYIVAKDPDDDNRCVVACSKSNLGPPPPSITYEIKAADNDVARVEWIGKSNHDAASLLAFQQDGSIEAGTRAEAVDFLRETLASGPRFAKELLKEAKDVAISETTLRRAKKHLGVQAFKQRFDGPWMWSLHPRQLEAGHDGGEDGQ